MARQLESGLQFRGLGQNAVKRVGLSHLLIIISMMLPAAISDLKFKQSFTMTPEASLASTHASFPFSKDRIFIVLYYHWQCQILGRLMIVRRASVDSLLCRRSLGILRKIDQVQSLVKISIATTNDL